jgi:hypothetical protein
MPLELDEKKLDFYRNKRGIGRVDGRNKKDGE